VAVEGVDMVHEVLSVRGTVEEEEIGGIYGRWPMIVVRDSLERNGLGRQDTPAKQVEVQDRGKAKMKDTK
jgi:hypothetical protein